MTWRSSSTTIWRVPLVARRRTASRPATLPISYSTTRTRSPAAVGLLGREPDGGHLGDREDHLGDAGLAEAGRAPSARARAARAAMASPQTRAWYLPMWVSSARWLTSPGRVQPAARRRRSPASCRRRPATSRPSGRPSSSPMSAGLRRPPDRARAPRRPRPSVPSSSVSVTGPSAARPRRGADVHADAHVDARRHAARPRPAPRRTRAAGRAARPRDISVTSRAKRRPRGGHLAPHDAAADDRQPAGHRLRARRLPAGPRLDAGQRRRHDRAGPGGDHDRLPRRAA